MQCSAVPCTAVPCSNVQCSAAQCSPQCSAMRKAAVQCYSATLCNALNGSSVLCNRRRAGGGGGCHCCCCNAGGIAHVSAGERASLCVCVYAPAALPLSFASMQCRQHRHRSRPLIVRRACRAFPAGGGRGGPRGGAHREQSRPPFEKRTTWRSRLHHPLPVKPGPPRKNGRAKNVISSPHPPCMCGSPFRFARLRGG